MRINSNIPALAAQRHLSKATQALSRSLARLSSGRRINEARDDAAGLAMSEGINSQVRGLRQIALNINQAFGYLQTADGILSTQLDLVQRMKELALQASNGTISSNDRKMLETELLTLVEEFDRIAEQANFNGSQLLDGSFGTLSLQVGLHKGETIDFNLKDSRGSAIFTSATTVGTGNFSLDQSLLHDGAPGLFQYIGDIDNDGDGDMVVLGAFNSETYLYRREDDGNYSQTTLLTSEKSMAFEDLNGDGLVDFVSNNNTQSTVYMQNSNGTFTAGQTFSSGVGALRDFDSDGDLDYITDGHSAPQVALNDGNGRFVEAAAGSLPTGSASVAEDINGDGILDAVAIEGISNRVRYLIGRSDGSFGSVQTLALGAGITSIRMGDFTGDGILDVVGLHSSNGNAVIHTGSTSGTFTAQPEITSAVNFSHLLSTADFNNDGYDDLMFANTTSNTAAVRLSNGNGTFSVAQTISIAAGATPGSYQTNENFVDIDGDGNLDLVMYGVGSIYLHWGNGSGGFSFGSSFSIYEAYEPDFVDLDSDGDLDIAVYSETFPGSYIAGEFLLNNGDRTFTLGSANTLFTNVGKFDINGDGILDYVLSDDPNNGPSFYTYLQETEVIEEATAISMQTQAEAQGLLNVFDRAIQKLNERRASIGATVSRLESAQTTTGILSENLSAARSQIMDADISQEVAEVVRFQILQQAQATVLTQANSSLQMALQLLRP